MRSSEPLEPSTYSHHLEMRGNVLRSVFRGSARASPVLPVPAAPVFKKNGLRMVGRTHLYGFNLERGYLERLQAGFWPA